MVHTPAPQPSAPQGSSLSFTQGFLLGQLSIALLIAFFIKFFIFGEPPSPDDRALHLASLRRARTLAHQNSVRHLRTRSNSTTNPLRHKHSRSIIRNPVTQGGPSIATILAKTYYNVKGHQPESLDWFNVLVAQTIAQLRADARQDGAVLTSLTDLLNGGVKPDWIGEIKVTEIALGDEYPIFSNCKVMPAEEGFAVGGASGAGLGGNSNNDEARLQARMDVDLSDVITIGIETTLVLNYPKPRIAVLPVALAVSVVRFSGTLAVSFIPSSSPPSTSIPTPAPTPAATPSQHPQHHRRNSSSDNPHRPSTPDSPNTNPSRPTTLAFTFLDDYRLDLSVRSLVGSRSRLQDVPKIAQLIESRVHAWFDERAVEPRFQQIVLPSLWPRKHNTRGGEEEEESKEEGVEGDDVVVGKEGVDEVGIPLGGGPDITINPAVAVPPPERPKTTAESLEERIAAEGAKMREAEIRAGERSRESERSRERERTGSPSGMRWRNTGIHHHHHRREQSSRQSNRFSGEWSGQRGMPGAMPLG